MKKPETITVAITALGAGGDGVAAREGTSVYVPKTAPGDVIEARLESENADGIQARLVKIVTPAPERVPAPCPYFARCGGCSLQHVNENFYRGWKIHKVLQNLERAGIEVGQIEAPVFLPAATRRRTTMAALKSGKDIRLGYFEYRSHNIIDAKTCLILEPALESKMQALRPYLPRLLPDRKQIDITMQHAGGVYDMVLTGLKPPFSLEQLEVMAELAEALEIARVSTREKEFAPLEIAFTRTNVIKKFGALQVSLPPAAFLQASNEGEEALMRTVSDYAKNARVAADLFSGCGTFTGALLQNGASVHAIDGDADAIKALAATKHKNLAAKRQNLFKDSLKAAELQKFDTVIFDPPRAGAKAQCEQLALSNVETVIAVSCNPATFARDAKILHEGGYDLQSLRIIDQFVWSAHVELVACFKK